MTDSLYARLKARSLEAGEAPRLTKHPDLYAADYEAVLKQSPNTIYLARDYTNFSASSWDAALSQAVSDVQELSASQGGAVLVLPAGLGVLGASISITQDNTWLVMEPGCHLRMASGANLDYMIRLGYPASSTSTAQYIGLLGHGARIDGRDNSQSGGTGGLLEVINVDRAVVSGVVCTDAYDAGFLLDTNDDDVSGASLTDRSRFSSIVASECQGEFAMKILGSKDNDFSMIAASNNGRGGILFQGKAFNDDDGDQDFDDGNAELNQTKILSIRASNNGNQTSGDGYGVVFDNTTRMVVEGGTINFNPMGAIQFRRTVGTAGIDGSNQGSYIGIDMRNNGNNASCVAGGISTQNSGDLSSASITACRFQNNFNTNPDQRQVYLQGVSELTFMQNIVRLGPSVGVELDTCTQATVFGNVITSNGTATPSAQTPHGMLLHKGGGVCAYNSITGNAKTNSTHGGYSLYAAGNPKSWLIGPNQLDANEDGYEFGADAPAIDDLLVVGPSLLRGEASFIPEISVTGANQNVILPMSVFTQKQVRIVASSAASIDSFTFVNVSKVPPDGFQMTVLFGDSNITMIDASGDTGQLVIQGGDYVSAADKVMIFTFAASSWRAVYAA